MGLDREMKDGRCLPIRRSRKDPDAGRCRLLPTLQVSSQAMPSIGMLAARRLTVCCDSCSLPPTKVNIRLFDLHKLHNFPGWRWKDVQKTLSSHKKTKVSILIYDEKKVALDALAAELELTHFYEMPHPSQPTT
ncbi:uncharacterized protein LOC133923802 isoform X2 [Phragmites australis]|uniref:uncharacterized protein LOC133923802 isoform X2 n=1 Tax=Phragmites australis TaxID=29695 RepID=UPI002D766721|nr:uncharacterized protein LOC133923802 isoform X2 [Phragmites australis]